MSKDARGPGFCPDTIALFAKDALEAKDGHTAEAALLLMEAAGSIVLSRLSGEGAKEIARMLAEGLVDMVDSGVDWDGA